VTALAELGFVTEEDGSNVLTAGNDGATAEALFTGEAAYDAGGVEEAGNVFDCDALCVGTKDAKESRKYHAPEAAAAIRPAAIPIQIPLPLPLGLVRPGVVPPRSEFPNNGVAGVYFGVLATLFAGAVACLCEETGSVTVGAACRSANWLFESLAPSSAGGA
jgi:hypothetical protein